MGPLRDPLQLLVLGEVDPIGAGCVVDRGGPSLNGALAIRDTGRPLTGVLNAILL